VLLPRRCSFLAAILVAWLCAIVAPARVGAVALPPQKTASWGAEVLPSGRLSNPPLPTQDCIRVAESYAYNVALGRADWLSRDPIEEEGGLNLYGYVENNPVNAIDPDGLLTVNIWTSRGKSEAWGHASDTLDNGTHISWWPSSNRNGSKSGKGVYSAPPNIPQTYADDRRLEGDPGPPMDPDQQIYIPGLDEAAIEKWWEDYQKNGQWKTLSNNCSTIMYRALRAGGAPRAGTSVWTPKSAAKYAEKVQKKNTRRP